MCDYSSSHLSDRELMLDMPALASAGRENDALLLSRIAEADARKLFLPAGYPSMFAYCMEVLRLSEESAGKRIHAARAARRFPTIFGMIADGRLHLSAVVMLAPRLTKENAHDLLDAVAGQTKSGIALIMAERFPKADVPARLAAIVETEPLLTPSATGAPAELAPSGMTPCTQHAPGRVEASDVRGHVRPLAPQKFALQLTIDQATHDKLQYFRSLVRHRVPSGNLSAVLSRALDLAIGQVEKRKFGKGTNSRKPRRSSTRSRHIPTHIRKAVSERDGGQCTYVSESGKRCGAREFLEFDHVHPVARGGQSTVENLRLRCGPHNQFEAERAFGAGFMETKRANARITDRARVRAPSGTNAPEDSEHTRRLDV